MGSISIVINADTGISFRIIQLQLQISKGDKMWLESGNQVLLVLSLISFRTMEISI